MILSHGFNLGGIGSLIFEPPGVVQSVLQRKLKKVPREKHSGDSMNTFEKPSAYNTIQDRRGRFKIAVQEQSVHTTVKRGIKHLAIGERLEPGIIFINDLLFFSCE